MASPTHTVEKYRKENERKCNICLEVGDEKHYLLRCMDLRQRGGRGPCPSQVPGPRSQVPGPCPSPLNFFRQKWRLSNSISKRLEGLKYKRFQQSSYPSCFATALRAVVLLPPPPPLVYTRRGLWNKNIKNIRLQFMDNAKKEVSKFADKSTIDYCKHAR